MRHPPFLGPYASRLVPIALVLTAASAPWAASRSEAAEPVALRVDSFAVSPAHTPSAVVHVKNLTQACYEGVVRVKAPAGWSLKMEQQSVALAAGDTKQLRYLVQRGVAVEENSYSLEVSAAGAGATVAHRQNVAAASAPYFKPQVDGDASDWKDAIPVTWTTRAKATTVSTYWNRKQFAVLIAVAEDRLVPLEAGGSSRTFDAVQLAISSHDAPTDSAPDGDAGRYEFLLAPTSPSAGRCFLLAIPGTRLAQTQSVRELEALAYGDAELAVWRKDGITYYECAVPFKLIRDDIPPGEGREFCLSVLVHDPDGTGIRDWGEAAGLWPWQRNRLAWSQWQGAAWGERPPFDNKTPWGMCSSKY
ncbi:MAG: hypothetical protein HUU20_12490 [Pirellulales bacterium]|nr:hypothetical protein [Pirellulales bacterium]